MLPVSSLAYTGARPDTGTRTLASNPSLKDRGDIDATTTQTAAGQSCDPITEVRDGPPENRALCRDLRKRKH